MPADEDVTRRPDDVPSVPVSPATRTDPATPPRRRWPRRLVWTATTLVLVLAVAVGAVGWYYADELLLVQRNEPDRPIEVVSVGDDRVVLIGEGADEAQITGLEWDGGYARLGAQAWSTAGAAVEREFIAFPDVPEVGTFAQLHFYAAPVDLASVSDLDVEEITFDAELGALSATFVDGDSPRWVIFVHGRGATRAETYRLLPAVAETGHPSMAISYRNDEDEPADPDGEFGLGWTESADLASAVDYALARGAEDVVLVGFSMGGAIVGNYVRTEGDEHLAGLVYDSPVLSWTDTLDFEADNRGLPSFLTPLASAAVRVRTGIRFDQLDQVRRSDELTVPVLLIHGTGDETVPVTSSDAFAEARRDLVTYLRPEGAGHVQAWNADPEGYEAAVTEFLRSLP